MNFKPDPLPSHLFVVRLWTEGAGDDKAGWRGQVRHVLSGETRYFRDWPTLVNHMREMLPARAKLGET